MITILTSAKIRYCSILLIHLFCLIVIAVLTKTLHFLKIFQTHHTILKERYTYHASFRSKSEKIYRMQVKSLLELP